MASKKYIGILGLGSETTAYYFKKLNEIYHTIHGGYSTCPIKLLNANFNDINPYLPDNFNAITKVTKDYLEEINSLSVHSILVPNITLHETIERIYLSEEIDNKLIDIIKVLVKKMKEKEVTKVVLFGSKYTMNASYIHSKLIEKGIQTLEVTEEDQKFIDDLRIAIYHGKKINEKLSQWKKLINKYSSKSAIVLACTELSIAAENITSNNLFDMVTLHIEEAIHSIINK